ncbi:uncharacterized protein [Ptychodera flava]|uniref:uncharacterized protein n=1 Tax=Ptychodera flava TaxID=63121 RepID=UPI003969E7FD
MATLRINCKYSPVTELFTSLRLGSYQKKSARVTSSVLQPRVRRFTASSQTKGIIKSQFDDVQIPSDQSLPECVMSNFDLFGDQVALIDGVSNESYTFRELKNLVRRCGSGLVKSGFVPGDVCALYKPNSPEYFLSFYSVASVGGIVTTVNTMYTVGELRSQLEDSNAKWLVTHPSLIEKAKEAANDLPTLKGIYVLGDDNIPGCSSFSKLMTDDGSAFPKTVNINPREDVVFIPYSSGTMGPSKGAMLTHYNFIAGVKQSTIPGYFKYQPGLDVLPGLLPFFHIYGMAAILSAGLYQGAKVVTLPNFEPDTFFGALHKYKVTRGMIVSSLLVSLTKHPNIDKYDLSSLVEILSTAAYISQATLTEAKRRIGNENLFVRQGYGLTETLGVTMTSSLEEFCPGSVGKLVPNTEAKVIDVDTGRILGAGEDGELCFRGPQIMKGYLNNEKATRQTITEDGWLHTGDIGHYDEAGHFYMVDRLKEIIKYKGRQVAPAELEKIILSIDGVQDVVVVGRPDEEAGELPKAFVVPKSETITTQDIVNYVEENVAPYKKLRGGVEFVDQIPKTASGKSLRRVMKDRELARADRK